MATRVSYSALRPLVDSGQITAQDIADRVSRGEIEILDDSTAYHAKESMANREAGGDIRPGMLNPEQGSFTQGLKDTMLPSKETMKDMVLHGGLDTTIGMVKGAATGAVDQAKKAWESDKATAKEWATGVKRLASGDFRGSNESFSRGADRALEGAGHVSAAALPLVGPAAAHAGEQIKEGNIEQGLGEGAGLIGSVVVPEVAGKVVGRVAPAAGRVVGRMANRQYAKALGGTEEAAAVAPRLVKEGVVTPSRKALGVRAEAEAAKAGAEIPPAPKPVVPAPEPPAPEPVTLYDAQGKPMELATRPQPATTARPTVRPASPGAPQKPSGPMTPEQELDYLRKQNEHLSGENTRLSDENVRNPVTEAPGQRSWNRLRDPENGARRSHVGMTDMDNFKDVNDTYGHGAGDALLQAQAQAMEQAAKEAGADWAHIHGDEMVLQHDSPALVEATIKRAQQLFSKMADEGIYYENPDGTIVEIPRDRIKGFSYGIGKTEGAADAVLKARKEALHADRRRAPASGQPGAYSPRAGGQTGGADRVSGAGAKEVGSRTDAAFWNDVADLAQRGGKKTTAEAISGAAKGLIRKGVATTIGHAIGGPVGAAAGLILDKAMQSTLWRTASAVTKGRIASLIANGDMAGAARLAARLTAGAGVGEQDMSPADLASTLRGQR